MLLRSTPIFVNLFSSFSHEDHLFHVENKIVEFAGGVMETGRGDCDDSCCKLNEP
jgi:hypothetical protein